MAHETIASMIAHRIEECPGDAALRVKRDGRWTDITWSVLGERMEHIAAGLLTAMELEPRDAITILGNTSADWIACDFGALSVGLRTVPVYATLLPEEVGYLHVDTEARLAIVEDAEGLEKVRAIREGFTFFEDDYSGDRVKLEHIVVMNPEGIEPADDWESLADLEERGRASLEETAEERRRRSERPGRDDTCTYTYTSGTTGPPKGVIQTNDNMLAMLESADSTGIFDGGVAEGGLFLFLPLAHSFGRLIEFAGPFFGAPIVVSSIPTLGDDLKATRPGFFPAAPRVYEKMMAKIESAVAGAPPVRQALFNWALDAGKATIPYRATGRGVPFFTQMKFNLADKLVLSKLRAKLGFDRAKILLSGSAALNTQVHEFFLACGLDLLEAYGLTETCPGLTTNLPNQFKLGTVGLPFPGIDIRIADDNEILARGANITEGYLNRPDATEKAFDSEGWFHTGDLGAMDADGFVKITGRKKALMKTSGGKYIAPVKIEGRIKTLPMIQEVIAVADYRNYATALIALDPEELAEWAKQTGNEPDPHSDAVREAVQQKVNEVNETLASYETIKYFRIIPMLTVEDGLLTASLKVKRGPVHERYADLIDEMYDSARKPAAAQ
jgi:long-chain acyl-CoA synthetase